MTEAEQLEIASHIIAHVRAGTVRVTVHAHAEMVEDGYAIEELLAALLSPTVLENYAAHRRGSCALVLAFAKSIRPVHIVCSTSLEVLVIITVYEPRLPKWKSPTERT